MKLTLVPPLPAIMKGKEVVELRGSSIKELLEELWSACPEAKDKLLDEQGRLRSFVNVFLNGEDVRGKEGEATEVRDGDEVALVLAISGGAR